ncbi:MAG: hypothetical protein KME54_28020 [Tolypothrix brevis GSE-NOS-MK-07-07A]|jgi:hypothetical protein|nr:hypothetical protein [Tolypothrix brevis GSE-NOS-MK-07-07A]
MGKPPLREHTFISGDRLHTKRENLQEMKPTVEQTIELYKMCQNLTSMYLPINLVTIDERTKNFYLLAGEELEVLINPQGEVSIL